MTQDTKLAAELQIASACKPTEIDINIVVHNQYELTRNCLESIEQTTPNYHLYIHDNASDSVTRDYLKSVNLHGGKLVRGKVNEGFLKPNNALAEHGSSPYIILLNNDTYCLPGWWEPLIGCLQNYPSVGVAGYCGGSLNSEGVGSAASWGFDVDYVCGWCMAIRREDYKKLGLFDDKHLEFAYCEDADFCFRLRESGLTTYAFSLNLVWHKGSATSTSISKDVLMGPFAKNHLYMQGRWKKYLGKKR